ncbi:MAG TPA: hypothetical protein VGM86_15555 [Thermoanaerobaculia bacterium]|jgi:hypothetical protein
MTVLRHILSILLLPVTVTLALEGRVFTSLGFQPQAGRGAAPWG